MSATDQTIEATDQKVEPKAPAIASAALGDIAWLLMQSKMHRHFFLADLEWFVLPALLNNQFKVYRNAKQPVGVAFWAYLSEDVEKRMMDGQGRISPPEWNSGDQLWLISLVAPYGNAEKIIKDLYDTNLESKPFKFHAFKDGKRTVVEYPTSSDAQQPAESLDSAQT